MTKGIHIHKISASNGEDIIITNINLEETSIEYYSMMEGIKVDVKKTVPFIQNYEHNTIDFDIHKINIRYFIKVLMERGYDLPLIEKHLHIKIAEKDRGKL